ncbi:MAG: hypothetical protein DRI87_07635, partial [Bacteroidetes bacterium]
AILSEYTAAPLFKGEEIAHQWLIEFEKQPDNFEFFNEAFDNALKSVNSDYEAKRYHDFVLKPPIVVKLPKGTFYHWMKKRNKLGGQNKVPRLSNDRKYLDEIQKLLKEQGEFDI